MVIERLFDSCHCFLICICNASLSYHLIMEATSLRVLPMTILMMTMMASTSYLMLKEIVMCRSMFPWVSIGRWSIISATQLNVLCSAVTIFTGPLVVHIPGDNTPKQKTPYKKTSTTVNNEH